jgi:hypothetical protein
MRGYYYGTCTTYNGADHTHRTPQRLYFLLTEEFGHNMIILATSPAGSLLSQLLAFNCLPRELPEETIIAIS